MREKLRLRLLNRVYLCHRKHKVNKREREERRNTKNAHTVTHDTQSKFGAGVTGIAPLLKPKTENSFILHSANAVVSEWRYRVRGGAGSRVNRVKPFKL